MGYMEQISLASLALNLLDRCPSIDAGLDLLSRRLKARYGMENIGSPVLIMISFPASLEYQWKHLHGLRGKTRVLSTVQKKSIKIKSGCPDQRSAACKTAVVRCACFQENRYETRPVWGSLCQITDSIPEASSFWE